MYDLYFVPVTCARLENVLHHRAGPMNVDNGRVVEDASDRRGHDPNSVDESFGSPRYSQGALDIPQSIRSMPDHFVCL